MNKDRELEEIQADLDFQTKLWDYADLLRSSHNLTSDDFHIVFLLMSLYQDSLIDVTRRDYSHQELLNIISKDSFYSKLSDFYNITLPIFDFKDIQQILDIISATHSEEFKINFKDVFEIVLKMLIDMQHRSAGNSLLQSEVAWFMNELAGLDQFSKVFNPFSGYASFGIHRLQEQYYLGHEINKKIWVISLLRLKAHNRHENQEVLLKDTFNSWPLAKNFDLVIANPPFNLRLPKYIDSLYGTVEQYVIQEGLKLLNSKGKLIITVPLRFLQDQREKDTVKYLIDQDIIEAVITFPGGLLMHTQIPFAIILINKGKKMKNQVGFFHGSESVIKLARGRLMFHPEGLLEEIEQMLNPINYVNDNPDLSFLPDWHEKPEFVDRETIINNNYSLDIRRYWLARDKGIPIKEIISEVTPYTFGKALKLKGLDCHTFSGDKRTIKVPYISTKDLSNDYKEYRLNLSTIQSKDLKTGRFLYQDVYLVTLSGKSLKPSFLNMNEGDSFVLSNDLFAFLVDEKRIDPRWLIKELSSDSIKDKLNLLSYGVNPRIKKEDFLNLKINVPPLKDQQEEINKLLNLEKQVDELESDIIEQNSYLRHSVAGPISDLDHALKSIDDIIKGISKNEMPEILSKKISDDHLYSLGEYLIDSKKYIALINDTVTNKLSSSQNIERKQMERINLLGHIENYVSRKNEAIQNESYSIIFDYDGDFFKNKLNAEFKFILGNAELINAILDNMIDNAVKHAFTTSKHNWIEIYAWAEDSDNQISFSISNSGKSLQDGTKLKDLKRKGYRDSSKEGDGFGLWFVNEVVRKHNAEWFLINELWNEYPLKTDIYVLDELSGEFFNDIQLNERNYVTKFSFHFPIYKKR